MTTGIADLRWDVVSPARLRELVDAPLPAELRASAPRRTFFRDVYFDTPDSLLRRRGAECRLRLSTDDVRVLTLRVGSLDGGTATRLETRVRAITPRAALDEPNAVTRHLCGLVDPARLEAQLELEVERVVRHAERDWLRRPRLTLHYDQITVRRETSARSFQQISVRARPDAVPQLAALAASFEGDHGLRRLATDPLERAELLLKWMPAESGAPIATALTTTLTTAIDGSGDDEFLDPDLSLLAFQERVVALAEDPAVPLAERLRFLAIVAANLDEFFTIRVAGLKAAVPEALEECGGAGPSMLDRLGPIASGTEALQRRQYDAFRALVPAIEPHGVRIRAWDALSATERQRLRAIYREDIHAELTPLAMTMSPGHPFPRLPHLLLQIAVVLVNPGGGAPHLAQIEIPSTLPGFVIAPSDGVGARVAVPIEEVVRANLDVLYPGLIVEQAYFFRVTRGGDIALDDGQVDDLLEAVDRATQRRGESAVVRVEIERAMPMLLRELVLDALRREQAGSPIALGLVDLYEVDGLLDLRRLTLLAAELPEHRYPPFTPAAVETSSLFDTIRAGDLLVHHPFTSFAGTVARFVEAAARDPDVSVLKMTLYRAGDRSPIVEALCDAARAGKQVYAFVELRARFDEERNVRWVRALEGAGVHVVYGLRGLKTHAKAVLVVRREGGQTRRYAHVGTGNYNVQTGLAYTDLSLFTAEEAVASDLADLFNSLTGSSDAPARMAHGSLVAPNQMLGSLLDMIDQEARHARRGLEAVIRIKVNGLSDPDVVRALARASQAGARVDLIVRGICTLRPAVPGQTDNVRVVANTGRFLEHSRIYHFANAGNPRVYIGSADLRPRNLRRRVELLVPVRNAALQERLDGLLDLYLTDPAGWELEASGGYVPRSTRGPSAQQVLLDAAAVAAG